MIEVIIVDDEPSASMHVKSIIEKKCPDFQVVAIAEDGAEGLKMVRELKPEVVISDVKMPIMSGIEMVSAIKTEFSDIFSVIISGYDEFEYAQSAIRSGVCEYLLKPVLPSALKKILDGIEEKVRKLQYLKRKDIIARICRGMSLEKESIARYYPYEKYYGAIIRKNGLPRRFSLGNDLEICSDVDEIITVYGRDEMEALYLMPKELLFGKTFEQYIKGVYCKETSENQYVTMVYGRESFSVEELQKKVQEFYKLLDSVSVVGENQAVRMEVDFPRGRDTEQKLSGLMARDMEGALQERQYDKFKVMLQGMFQKWHQEKRTQLWMEQMTRQILYMVRKYQTKPFPLTECEYMMEDAFFYSISVEELSDSFQEIVFKHFREDEGYKKVDSPEFFERIKEYMIKHMSENITLQGVCKRFGISQTYLSKLFRKYEQDSFNRCLTAIRLNKAMELMRLNHGIFIKDVATRVGYSDQFYFSRIFRAYAGICPTDYINRLEEENESFAKTFKNVEF